MEACATSALFHATVAGLLVLQEDSRGALHRTALYAFHVIAFIPVNDDTALRKDNMPSGGVRAAFAKAFATVTGGGGVM